MATTSSAEERQTIVDLLEIHPMFYNKKPTTYKDTDTKERLKTEKAADLRNIVEITRTWYNRFRSQFGRFRKNKFISEEPEQTERDEWILEISKFYVLIFRRFLKGPLSV